MNIDFLKAFAAVAKTGSLTQAAEELFITQPALSQQIKQLENYFSIQLLERSNRGTSLTEAGKLLYDYSTKIADLFDELESKMDSLRASVEGSLTIGATSVVGGYAVPCSIFIFKEKYPETNLKLKVGNQAQVINDLKDEIIDVAVIEGDQVSGPFAIEEIATDDMTVIVPNKKPWNGKKYLLPEDFVKQPLIMREHGSGTRQVVENCLRSAGIDISSLNIVMELSSVDSIKAAVEAGHGISIMSRLALKKELHNKTLKAVDIKGIPLKQKIYLAYKTEKAQSTVARAFIKFLRLPSRGFC
ncbi:selenium metabolism-associated LysR family transcriptional regulator [Tepidanaerobacter acetatoxydans]|uniref:selenium metabolism-associated LysR family transcriptional regulator n=1 Tax=Tepidanaerobacter acetatoxydans TaxID=499229 RepID=UPI00020BFA6F|nr:selenium metabolism-associated LysR family transcriptional regulator [Tepidanaerobacter acetatoxydans]AEE92669.1 transcriptional regulator, LysR family [Tepidanaerobacter acetatoxydans Re1]